MIVKAKRNMFLYANDEFKDVYINPNKILSIERYEGNYEGKTIIRLSDDFSYISNSSFEELMEIFNPIPHECLSKLLESRKES